MIAAMHAQIQIEPCGTAILMHVAVQIDRRQLRVFGRIEPGISVGPGPAGLSNASSSFSRQSLRASTAPKTTRASTIKCSPRGSRALRLGRGKARRSLPALQLGQQMRAPQFFGEGIARTGRPGYPRLPDRTVRQLAVAFELARAFFPARKSKAFKIADQRQRQGGDETGQHECVQRPRQRGKGAEQRPGQRNTPTMPLAGQSKGQARSTLRACARRRRSGGPA